MTVDWTFALLVSVSFNPAGLFLSASILQDCIGGGRASKCNIIVTQPRRISATSLANRVSEEIGESPKDGRNNLCGYQIRFQSRKSPFTRLLYCTTGVVLRQLQSDKDLSNVSHLIIDEVGVTVWFAVLSDKDLSNVSHLIIDEVGVTMWFAVLVR